MRIDDSLLKYSAAVEAAKLNNEAKIKSGLGTRIESFESLLSEAVKTESVTFSKHALARMSERDIELSNEEMQMLNSAIESADSKGIKDSLILMNSKAFIVNVPSNVVVTVLNSNDISEQKVFTNLDGAVII